VNWRWKIRPLPESSKKLGIDYCCGGNKSLEDACRASNLSVDQVIDSLEMAEEAAHATQKDRNWQIEPLADLITNIKSTHHKFTREEMARLVPLLEKVCSVHGKNHPELQQVRASFHRSGPSTKHSISWPLADWASHSNPPHTRRGVGLTLLTQAAADVDPCARKSVRESYV